MKLTKENYELLMFDLLEGNLPEDVAADLHDQISKDEFYRKEWSLFESTVLIPDTEIVFTKKESLMKSDDKVIPIRTWIAISVAASILLALFIFIPKNNIDQPVVESPRNHTELPQEAEEPKLEENKNSEPFNSANLVEESKSPSVDVPSEKSDLINDEQEFIAEKPQEEFVDNKTLNDLFDEPIEFKSVEIPDADTNTIPVNQIARNNPIDDFLDHNVTNNPIERISSKLIYTIAKLSQPKMKVQPNWKEKNFKIELETTGYHAIASVDPFKKK